MTNKLDKKTNLYLRLMVSWNVEEGPESDICRLAAAGKSPHWTRAPRGGHQAPWAACVYPCPIYFACVQRSAASAGATGGMKSGSHRPLRRCGRPRENVLVHLEEGNPLRPTRRFSKSAFRVVGTFCIGIRWPVPDWLRCLACGPR